MQSLIPLLPNPSVLGAAWDRIKKKLKGEKPITEEAAPSGGLTADEMVQLGVGGGLTPEELADLQGGFDDIQNTVDEATIEASDDPAVLRGMKEKGHKLPDAKERIVWDAENNKPITQKVQEFAGAAIPAVGETIEDALVGGARLVGKGLLAPAGEATILAFNETPEQRKKFEDTKKEAGDAWRSFGSGAVGAFEGTGGAIAKALTGGTAATDALKEMVGMQDKDESFENYLTRQNFAGALAEDQAANPDRMAEGAAKLSENANAAGIAPQFSADLAEELRLQAVDKIDPTISSLGEVLAPVGPEALAVAGTAKLTAPVIRGAGNLAIKAGTKGVAPAVELLGKGVEGVGILADKLARGTGRALVGDEDTVLLKAFAQPIKAATLRPGQLLKEVGRFGVDLGRGIDEVGVAGRTGLFERAGSDPTSGRLARTVFGPGDAEKIASKADDVEAGAEAATKRAQQGTNRARIADKLGRLTGYYTNRGLNGAAIGTVMGLPDIEDAESAGHVVGSGVGIGLISASDPQNYHQARMEELRADQDADIARMRGRTSESTLKVLDSLADPKAFAENIGAQIDNLEITRADLAKEPASAERDASIRRVDQMVEKLKETGRNAMAATPKDIAELQRLINLEFTDAVEIAKTTGERAGLGDNIDIRIIGEGDMPAEIDRLFSRDLETAQAIISNLGKKQNLTPEETADLDKARATVAYVENAKQTWPNQRGVQVDPRDVTGLSGPTILLNGTDLLRKRGQNLSKVIRHEVLHGLLNFKEVRDIIQPIHDEYFDKSVQNEDGSITKVSDGLFPDAELDRMAGVYARAADPVHDGAMWLSQFESPEQLRDYMKEEVMAEAFGLAGGDQGEFRKNLDSTGRILMDWANLAEKNSLIGWTKDALEAMGVVVDSRGRVSNILGAGISDKALSLMRQLQRQLRDYNDAMTIDTTVKPKDAGAIPVTKIVANRALAKRYKNADFWDREMVVKVTLPDGTVISEVPIPRDEAEKLPIGSWEVKGGVIVDETGAPVTTVPKPVIAPEGSTVSTDVRIAENPDGSLKLLNKRIVSKITKQRNKVLREAIDNAPDDGTPGRLKDAKGNGSYTGTLQPSQIEALKKIPDIILPPHIKQYIEYFNDVLRRRDGTRVVMEYQAALRDGKYRSIAPRIRDVVPIGFQFSKDGNFLVTTISVSRLHDKLDTWVQEKPARLDLWGRDKQDFWQDFSKLLENHQNGVPGETGLSADPKVAVEKKNIINDLINLYDKETEGSNPDRSTSKKKRGQDSPDRTIMSARIDRILQMSESNDQKLPFDYGKVKANFLPDEMDADAPTIQTDTPQFKNWFGESKVVDDEGEPLVAYHGSNADFNEFSHEFMGTQGTTEGKGFYFTDNLNRASAYKQDGGKVYEVFLSIKNPITSLEQKTITKSQLKKIFENLLKTNPDALSNYGDVSYEGKSKVLSEAVNNEFDYAESDLDIIGSLVNGQGDFNGVMKAVTDATGLDGVILDWEGMEHQGKDQKVFIAFQPTQIKSAVDNSGEFDPSNPDIRFAPKAIEEASKFSTAKEFGESLPSSEREERGNNVIDKPYRGEFIPGTLSIDKYGENPYVYEDRLVDPEEFRDILKLEGMTYDEVVNMPTTQKYIEWYNAGELPPPITVVIRENDKRNYSTNRRRVVAALESGIKEIPARVEIGRRDDIFNKANSKD